MNLLSFRALYCFNALPLILVVGSSLKYTLRSETILGNLKHFKNDQKCFLFDLKSSFRAQKDQIFCRDFLIM